MTNRPTSFSALLKHLAKAADCLTEDEIADVVAGRRRLVLSTEEAAPSRTAGAAEKQQDFGTLIANLKSAETRESANRLIEDAALTRSQLTQIARALDLPTQGNDKVARIREKIVETTVGFRLTSNAIHRNG